MNAVSVAAPSLVSRPESLDQNRVNREVGEILKFVSKASYGHTYNFIMGNPVGALLYFNMLKNGILDRKIEPIPLQSVVARDELRDALYALDDLHMMDAPRSQHVTETFILALTSISSPEALAELHELSLLADLRLRTGLRLWLGIVRNKRTPANILAEWARKQFEVPVTLATGETFNIPDVARQTVAEIESDLRRQDA